MLLRQHAVLVLLMFLLLLFLLLLAALTHVHFLVHHRAVGRWHGDGAGCLEMSLRAEDLRLFTLGGQGFPHVGGLEVGREGGGRGRESGVGKVRRGVRLVSRCVHHPMRSPTYLGEHVHVLGLLEVGVHVALRLLRTLHDVWWGGGVH